MKEVAGLVSGVESGVSKERLCQEYNYPDWRSVRQHTKPQTHLIGHMCVDAQTKASYLTCERSTSYPRIEESTVSPSTRACVLCVDDDEDSRVMLITLLRQELIEAKAVGTAVQAIGRA
jgi:hypothetical protein